MTAQEELDTFIARYAPAIARLARATYGWLRRRFPAASVLVYDNYNALVIGFGPSEKPSEAVLSVALYPRWVSLFFLSGAGLPDPHGVLQGSGKRVRSIRIGRAEQLEEPAVRELIDTAADRGGLGAGGTGRILIQSVAARQRPRRPVSKAAAKEEEDRP